MSVEQMARDILTAAIDAGLVCPQAGRKGRLPADMSASDLIGPANLLARFLRESDGRAVAAEQARCLGWAEELIRLAAGDAEGDPRQAELIAQGIRSGLPAGPGCILSLDEFKVGPR